MQNKHGSFMNCTMIRFHIDISSPPLRCAVVVFVYCMQWSVAGYMQTRAQVSGDGYVCFGHLLISALRNTHAHTQNPPLLLDINQIQQIVESHIWCAHMSKRRLTNNTGKKLKTANWATHTQTRTHSYESNERSIQSRNRVCFKRRWSRRMVTWF